MRELVLAEPQGSLDAVSAQETAEAASRREFELLLPDSARLAFRIARAVLRDDADAEDVAQESLLRAFRRFDRLRDRTRFRAWLVRIAYRTAIDRVRSRKRREQRDTQWFRESASSIPMTNMPDAEFRARLEQAVGELPEKLRLVLLLSAIDGHTMEEVSSLQGVPVGTVKSRLFCARKKVAEKLRCFVKPIDNR